MPRDHINQNPFVGRAAVFLDGNRSALSIGFYEPMLHDCPNELIKCLLGQLAGLLIEVSKGGRGKLNCVPRQSTSIFLNFTKSHISLLFHLLDFTLNFNLLFQSLYINLM